jgi:hypothetical protein
VSKTNWHSCNVLRVGGDGRQVWRFNTDDGDVKLAAEQRRLPSEPLPVKLIDKDWQTLWRKKLNLAWLPVEQVFLRVTHLPSNDPAELQSMVELQLEKLSPLPVAQIVWGFEIFPHPDENTSTAVVIIVERGLVERFLGRLESERFLADRLELPLLQQLAATRFDGDGTWLYLATELGPKTCLAAWWYGGSLQNLSLIPLEEGENAPAGLWDQLLKAAWGGELEGWLTSPPRWRLVCDRDMAAIWQPALSQLSGQNVEVTPLLPTNELAALSARRATRSETRMNLMPAEYTTRYRQEFIDRLWMRGLVAVGAVYLIGVLIYLGGVEVMKYRRDAVAKEAAELSGSFTNALQLKAKIQILQDQSNLRFAALDSWRIVCELLPTELTLTSFDFNRGKVVGLRGTAAGDQSGKVTEFNAALIKVTHDGQPFFSRVAPATITPAGNAGVGWNFQCELKRVEGE